MEKPIKYYGEKTIKFPKLLAEMAKRGDTQETLAKLLELTQPCISRRLTGETSWSMEDIEKICEHYKKDYKKLFK